MEAEHLGRDAHGGDHRRRGDHRDGAGALGDFHHDADREGQQQHDGAGRLAFGSHPMHDRLVQSGLSQHPPERPAGGRDQDDHAGAHQGRFRRETQLGEREVASADQHDHGDRRRDQKGEIRVAQQRGHVGHPGPGRIGLGHRARHGVR